MTLLTGRDPVAGRRPRAPAPRRPSRRNAPLAVTGVLMVTGCALAFAVGWLKAGNREPVLILARGVTAGHVYTAADLQVAQVSTSAAVGTVPASQEVAVIGHAASAALPAGSLLAPGDVSAPALAPGQVLLGVAVKPGQYPPDLSAGQIVDVLSTPAGPAGQGGSSAPGGPGAAAAVAALPVGRAVVVAVYQDTSGAAVVELQVAQDAMPQVAAAAASGQIALATMPPAG